MPQAVLIRRFGSVNRRLLATSGETPDRASVAVNGVKQAYRPGGTPPGQASIGRIRPAGTPESRKARTATRVRAGGPHA